MGGWHRALRLSGDVPVDRSLVHHVRRGLVQRPEARDQVETFLKEAFPLLFDPQSTEHPVDIEEVATATVNAGVISVIGLLVAGLGWADSLLEGVRRMQGAMRRPRHR